MKQSILREFVRNVIVEEGDYGGIGDGYYYGDYGSGTGMYGMGGWGGKSVLSVFGSPFLDVAKTAYGSGKEVAAQAKGLARTGVEAALAMILPFVSGDYKKINEETHEEVKKIKKEYAPLYKSNLDAFFNTDLVTLAFFMNPAAVITGAAFDRFMYTPPDAALSVLGWFVPISGQKMWESLLKAIDPERLQKFLKTASGQDSKTKVIVWDDRNRRKLYANVRRAMGIEEDPNQKESLSLRGSVLSEKSTHGETTQQVVKGLFRDPSIAEHIKQSDEAKKLQELGSEILKKKLDRIVALVHKVVSASSSEEFGTKEAIDPGTLQKTKSDVKERLAKSLQAELSELGKHGIDPTQTGLSAFYERALKEINGMPVNKSPAPHKMPKRGANGQKEPDRGAGVEGGRGDGSDGSTLGTQGAKGSH